MGYHSNLYATDGVVRGLDDGFSFVVSHILQFNDSNIFGHSMCIEKQCSELHL